MLDLKHQLGLTSTIVLSFLFAVACGTGMTPAPSARATPVVPTPTVALPSAEARTHVIIDTDMALDDLMAILYLLERPDIRIEAITVSGTGEAHCQAGMQHALGLVTLVGAKDIPVACGRETPLQGTHAFPNEWRKRVDGSMGLEWRTGGQASKQSAVELLATILEAAPNPVVVVTLGPLTNLAEVLQAKPTLIEKIKMVYVMGGALNVPGNVKDLPQAPTQPTAEFNMYVDPRAANIVLQSGAPVTLVPLDATNQAPINQSFFEALDAQHITPAANATLQLFQANPFLYQRGDYYWWDPITAVIATAEGIAEFETRRVRVVEEGTESGRTKTAENGSPLRVAMKVDHVQFEQIFLSTLNGGAEVKIDRPTPGNPPSAPPPGMTVAIKADQCTYQGPEKIAAGDISIEWSVDKQHDKYGLAVVTLGEGKTFQDLDALVGDQQAQWIQPVGFWTLAPGERQVVVAHVTRGPIYLVCFTADPIVKLKTLGPVPVGE